MMTRLALAAIILAIYSTPLHAESIKVLGYNVESGKDTEPAEVAKVIDRIDGVDLWGLSEVQDGHAAAIFLNAASGDETGAFRSFIGHSGSKDRLQIIYDSEKFELLDTIELHYIRLGNRGLRAPLGGKFRIRSTDTEFYFMVNHLYRSKAKGRHQQAQLLNEWGKQADAPVIAVGDYNFDWDVVGGEANHDKGYDNMVAGGIFEWVRPDSLIKTQCSPKYNSVLDFVFVTGRAKQWNGESDILERTEEYCALDSQGGSDHRPVVATFEIR